MAGIGVRVGKSSKLSVEGAKISVPIHSSP